MFTGIVEHVGYVEALESALEKLAFDKNAVRKVALEKSAFKKEAFDKNAIRKDSLEKSAPGVRLRVNAGPLAASLAIAGSIAVNGCCLTIVEISGETFAADLSSETLRRTAFGEMALGEMALDKKKSGEIKRGAPVNLERPLAAGKEFGGHFVQGHVDGIGRVTRLAPEGANWWLGVRLPPELARYVAMKGSISIDGISLTVANLSGDVVEAAIIPFTYANTNLQALRPGDAVNIEADILAKYIERLLETRRPAATSALTLERLTEEGF